MRRTWGIILIIAAVLAVGGIICIGVGLMTGASTERMIESVFGGREEMELMFQLLSQELGEIFG
ncbi:MAG: hypothetical protein LUE97_02510 [Oscillospiraceae bacterium]|nr:hypothetical protein [Oscillospiraceae bacterium]MCD8191712.1 hypothetical protein [Oscillospiraceae bacterium]